MEKHPIGELMETTMSKIREMVDVNTIVGTPIKTDDGITLIPVSKVSFGFAGGAGLGDRPEGVLLGVVPAQADRGQRGDPHEHADHA